MIRSVAAKLFIAVFAVLLLNLGLLGYANVQLHRKHLEDARLSSAQRLGDVVQRSTSYYMLRNDRAALSHIVETIGKERDMTRLRITDMRGRVGFSTDPKEIGSIVPLKGVAEVARAEVSSLNGERHVSTMTPILNAPSCASAACHAHPQSEHQLGLLEIDLSLAGADADVRKASFQFISYSAVAILLTLATIGGLVYLFVHEPVRRLREGTKRLGSGELGVQIPVSSGDELGTLAQSFNEMSHQLKDAQAEITAWTHTLEERVEAKTAELQRAHQQMIQAEKLTSLGKLAAIVAHEINNPLSGILTYAKLLRKWIDRGDPLQGHAEEMRESLLLIESESRRCGDIVRNLLTFARVHPLNITDVDVNRLVRQCIKLVEHKLDLGAIVPQCELQTDVPLVRGDGGQIEQLLLALIMNAIEAMPHGGNLRVSTEAARDRNDVVIRIEDDGIGIPADLLPRLFEPFVSTKEDGKGVGLGLAISRAIVDRHHGHIEVKSEVGRGTAFIITLPVAALASLPERTAA